MNGLNVDDVPRRVVGKWARRNAFRSPAPIVARGRWSILAMLVAVVGIPLIEQGIRLRDRRPSLRVGGRFAGEVTGVEFGDGGVELVGVEQFGSGEPIVYLDFDDADISAATSPGAELRTEERTRMSARRCPRVATTLDPGPRTRPRPLLACLRLGQHDRLRHRHLQRDADRASKSHRPLSRPSPAQSRAATYFQKRSTAWLAAFSSRRTCGLSSSNRASAASTSASSNTSTAVDRLAFDGQKGKPLATRPRSPPASSHPPHK